MKVWQVVDTNDEPYTTLGTYTDKLLAELERNRALQLTLSSPEDITIDEIEVIEQPSETVRFGMEMRASTHFKNLRLKSLDSSNRVTIYADDFLMYVSFPARDLQDAQEIVEQHSRRWLDVAIEIGSKAGYRVYSDYTMQQRIEEEEAG